MTGLLVDVQRSTVKIVNVSGLQDYYRLIGCTTVDIVNRKIGNKRYEIICDDEGLLTSEPIVSAIDGKLQPMLVGNLIIAGEADTDGNLTSLKADDLVNLNVNLRYVFSRKKPLGYPVICWMEY